MAETGSTRRTQRYGSPLIVVVAIFQSLLLVAQVLTFALPKPVLDPQTMQLVGVLTVLTASYLAYVMFAQISTSDEAPRDHAVPTAPSQTRSPSAVRRPNSNGCSPSDAEQLVRLKSRVSHELRTPLNAVIGFSEMMQQEVLGPVGNERYREYAAQIRLSAERFQRATEKTLAVTELLASPPKRLRDTINLSDLIRPSLETFRQTTGASEPAWRVAVCSTVLIEGNRAALADALHHLWGAGRQFAMVADDGEQANCAVTCCQTEFGYADLRFEIDRCNGVLLAGDSELSPGAELNLLLARLGVEAAGGALTIEEPTQNSWAAVIRMPLASQRELQLI